jgi:hypothetical protein
MGTSKEAPRPVKATGCICSGSRIPTIPLDRRPFTFTKKRRGGTTNRSRILSAREEAHGDQGASSCARLYCRGVGVAVAAGSGVPVAFGVGLPALAVGVDVRAAGTEAVWDVAVGVGGGVAGATAVGTSCFGK